jgi:RNA polymerase sigma-70 factor (ECF subfamily)
MTELAKGTQSKETASDALHAAPKKPDFRDLYRDHCGYVWNSLRRLGVREADIEDIAHEVFLSVYKRFADYDPARPIKPWLFGFAYRTASDYRARPQHRREVAEDAMDHVDEQPRADEQIEAVERRALVAQALARIELDRRAVFVMHEIDGVKIPEVADALSLPLNTAYSRLRLAREEFAEAVKRITAQKGGAR